MIASIVKKYLRPVLFFGGLPVAKRALRRVLGRRRVFVLMYHRVDYRSAPFFEVVVTPEVFDKQITYVKKNFEVVSLNEIETQAVRNTNKDIVVLTFDDGYRDNYTNAFPILKKHQIPATIFLATDYIGTGRLLWYDKLAWILHTGMALTRVNSKNCPGISSELLKDVIAYYDSGSDKKRAPLQTAASRLKILPPELRDNILNRLADVLQVKYWPGNDSRAMLSWQEVVEMANNGISFGCHTMSHPLLRSLTEQEARLEIAASRRLIEERIQKKVDTFAYPYGKRDDYQSDYIYRLLQDQGFVYCVSTHRGSESLPVINHLELKRKGVAPYPYLFL